ncbi:MAG TPA: hypothetical protein VFE50_00030 [Cyclobacteriaceae bacterium]|nr:hypothetical protein [Cyclobacteriaceae bacterium]
MKDFFKAIGLVKELTINLDCPKAYFIKSLEPHVDPSGYEFFEQFSKGPVFKGNIRGDRFSIRKRKKLFNPNSAMSVKLNGEVTQRDERAVVFVETSINATVFYPGIVILLFFTFAVLSMFANAAPGFAILVSVGQLIFLSVILYINLRGAVNRTIEETEREFVWIVRNYGR